MKKLDVKWFHCIGDNGLRVQKMSDKTSFIGHFQIKREVKVTDASQIFETKYGAT